MFFGANVALAALPRSSGKPDILSDKEYQVAANAKGRT
jgi:hypothetical protein